MRSIFCFRAACFCCSAVIFLCGRPSGAATSAPPPLTFATLAAVAAAGETAGAVAEAAMNLAPLLLFSLSGAVAATGAAEDFFEPRAAFLAALGPVAGVALGAAAVAAVTWLPAVVGAAAAARLVPAPAEDSLAAPPAADSAAAAARSAASSAMTAFNMPLLRRFFFNGATAAAASSSSSAHDTLVGWSTATSLALFVTSSVCTDIHCLCKQAAISTAFDSSALSLEVFCSSDSCAELCLRSKPVCGQETYGHLAVLSGG